MDLVSRSYSFSAEDIVNCRIEYSYRSYYENITGKDDIEALVQELFSEKKNDWTLKRTSFLSRDTASRNT
jgi:hypothetical protein